MNLKMIKFIFLITSLLGINLDAKVKLQVYTGEKVDQFESLMQQWSGEHYASYPYLYDMSQAKSECPPLGMFALENEAFLMLARDHGKTVGMLNAIALDSPFLNGSYFPEDTAAKIKAKGIDPKDVLYVAMFLVYKEERQNEALIFSMYNKMADLAKKMGKSRICYIDNILPEDHPLKPAVYQSPEPWEDTIKGFTSMDFTANLTWPTFQADGSTKDQTHTLLFYIKDL